MTCKSCFVVVKQAERHICKGRMAEGAFYFNRDKSKRPPKPFNQPLRVSIQHNVWLQPSDIYKTFSKMCVLEQNSLSYLQLVKCTEFYTSRSFILMILACHDIHTSMHP